MRLTPRAPDEGTRRVFRQSSGERLVPAKRRPLRPTHPLVTHPIRRLGNVETSIWVMKMNEEFVQVTIHLSRLGKPERSYQEGLVEDNGIYVKTFSIVPEAIGLRLSEKFHNQGWLLQDQLIHSVAKYLFYHEFFSIVEYQDRLGNVLGYYCDIVTPLQRNGEEYFLTDLILDLWIFPDFRVMELDRDEFETAVSNGLFPVSLERDALATFNRLKVEIEKGVFPKSYVS